MSSLGVLNTANTEIAVPVSSCNLTLLQQIQYSGIAITTLVLVIILVRSLTAFVKVCKP